MAELGPGVYLNVKDHDIKDNSISSIRLVSPRGAVTGAGPPLVEGRARPGSSSSSLSAMGDRRHDVCRSASRDASRSRRRTTDDYAHNLGEIAARLLAGA